MSCTPFDPNGESCPEDYYRDVVEAEEAMEQERLFPSSAPTDDEHHDAIIAGTYDSRTRALGEGLRQELERGR